jgi:hypothetical protein
MSLTQPVKNLLIEWCDQGPARQAYEERDLVGADEEERTFDSYLIGIYWDVDS